MKKKGLQMNEAFGAVLTLVLVGVLIIIGIYLFISLKPAFGTVATLTTVNETSNWLGATASVNATPYIISNFSRCNFAGITVTNLINTTDGVAVLANNYTISSNGTLIAANAADRVWDSVSISYTGKWGGPACGAVDTATSNFSNYPALIGLVGVIIFLALVIGVLIASFALGKKGV